MKLFPFQLVKMIYKRLDDLKVRDKWIKERQKAFVKNLTLSITQDETLFPKDQSGNLKVCVCLHVCVRVCEE